ncbi:DUF6221 family protein [Streptomyces sp. NPDC057596]|uniref:DUF6221 family protein n=1 Tax=Streptomyces sp. NPDC057596 TaxID=3346178 RepID=UPI0036CE725B
MTAGLPEWLHAQLDADEAAARRHWNRDGVTSERFHGTPYDPSRVLREIDAKRRIVELHRPAPGWSGRITPEHPHREPVCVICADFDRHGDPTGDPYPCLTLRLLALPYSDRPDYRDDWRP